jgi:hypothetical protein
MMPVIRRKLVQPVVETTPAASSSSKLAKIPEAAQHLGLSIYRIRTLINQGELKTVGSFKPFMLDLRDLDAYVLRSKVSKAD